MYDFAVNQVKLARAIAAIKVRGVEPTEELVKAEYIRIGGKVSPVKVVHLESKHIEDTVEVNKQPEAAVIATPRRGRRIS